MLCIPLYKLQVNKTPLGTDKKDTLYKKAW